MSCWTGDPMTVGEGRGIAGFLLILGGIVTMTWPGIHWMCVGVHAVQAVQADFMGPLLPMVPGHEGVATVAWPGFCWWGLIPVALGFMVSGRLGWMGEVRKFMNSDTVIGCVVVSFFVSVIGIGMSCGYGAPPWVHGWFGVLFLVVMSYFLVGDGFASFCRYVGDPVVLGLWCGVGYFLGWLTSVFPVWWNAVYLPRLFLSYTSLVLVSGLGAMFFVTGKAVPAVPPVPSVPAGPPAAEPPGPAVVKGKGGGLPEGVFEIGGLGH